jgi:cytochrome P450
MPVEARPPLVELLLAAEQKGELSRTETVSIMHTVLDAGYETTRTSISNAIELLATVPGLFEQLRSDPALVANAAEEFLRIRTPIHMRHRYLEQPYTATDGTVIPAGAQVLLMLAAANQDEAEFAAPLSIDLRRANAARHQAFGGGLHHCLGAPIARIQLQETLLGLARCYESFELPHGKGERYPSLVFPALASLNVIATRRSVSRAGNESASHAE